MKICLIGLFLTIGLVACQEVATTHIPAPECGAGGMVGAGGEAGASFGGGGGAPMACECTNAMAAEQAPCPESCGEPMVCIFVEVDGGTGHANCVGVWQ